MLKEDFQIISIPRERRFAEDAGYLGRRRHIIHGLVEADVTTARTFMRAHKEKTGESLSFTSFIIYCLAQAVDEHKVLNAYKNWRNQLVIYEDVNINTMVEVEFEGKKAPMPYIIQAANKRSFREIHDEIRRTQSQPHVTRESNFMRLFLNLPAFLRRFFYWFVMRVPQSFRQYSSPVLVTSVGMFGKGITWWGIPFPNFTLTVTLAGMATKPGVVEGRIEVREYQCMTISIDHDIIDGAPAARFGRRFIQLVESAYGLIDEEA